MYTNAEEVNRRKRGAARVSVASNATLVALKLFAGLAIGSVSVISEAVHSGVDLLAALIALYAVKKSGKPADENHPFGHGKVENLSGTVEALLIFLAAGWIVLEATKKLSNPEPLVDANWGAAVMLVSAIMNVLVSRHLFKVGKETDSVALQADAWHLRTDVMTSAGVMISLAVVWLGSTAAPGLDLHWVDPVAAIVVAMLILRAAWGLTIESARDLMDVSLPFEEEKAIRGDIATFAPHVRGYHNLRTRKAGSQRFVEFHMRVDPSMTVDESHRIADVMTLAIREQFPGTKVTIHIEPCNCDADCIDECLVKGEERGPSLANRNRTDT